MLLFALMVVLAMGVPLLVERKVNPQRSILRGLRRELSRYTDKGVTGARILLEIVVVDVCFLLASIPFLRWAREQSLVWVSFANAMVALVLLLLTVLVYRRERPSVRRRPQR